MSVDNDRRVSRAPTGDEKCHCPNLAILTLTPVTLCHTHTHKRRHSSHNSHARPEDKADDNAKTRRRFLRPSRPSYRTAGLNVFDRQKILRPPLRALGDLPVARIGGPGGRVAREGKCDRGVRRRDRLLPVPETEGGGAPLLAAVEVPGHIRRGIGLLREDIGPGWGRAAHGEGRRQLQ